MAKVLVSTNSNPLLFMDIYINGNRWSSLYTKNLKPFKIEELKRPCKAYPNGIFPGAEEISYEKQVSKINNFYNYIEFSKITEDEIMVVDGNQFLTTKYYDRRKHGWELSESSKNSGRVVGYCINGDVYNVIDQKTVEKIFYGVVYRSLVNTTNEFLTLQKYLQDGISLVLVGEDELFLNYLAEVLLINLQ